MEDSPSGCAISQPVHDEVIDFLAHLDVIRESPGFPKWSLNDGNSEEKITQIIELIRQSQSQQYTAEHIRSRLWRAFEPMYTYPEYNFARLFRHGSCEMDLEKEASKLLEAKVKKIRNDKLALPKTRSLRSRSALAASISTPSRSRARPIVMACQPSSTHKKKKHVSRVQNRVEKHDYSEILDTKKRSQSPTTTETLSTSIDRSNVAPATPKSQRESICSPKSTTHNYIEGGPFDHKEDRQTHRYDDPHILAQNYKVALHQLGHYKDRCKKLEQEREDRDKTIREMESAYTKANGTDKGILKQLRIQISRNLHLENMLWDQKQLEPYLDMVKIRDDKSDIDKIRSTYETLKDGIASVLIGDCAAEISVETLHGQSQDLDSLLGAIFKSRNELSVGSSTNDIHSFTVREIVQTLIGAAVKVYIFENTFSSTFLATTPLLQRYRQHIQTICGHEGFVNIDMAAHDTLIQEEDFRECVITPLASEYTERLLTVLSLVLGNRATEDPSEMVKVLAPRLLHIMSQAIRVRSLSLVNRKQFEMIWPAPGSFYDDRDMSLEQFMDKGKKFLVKLPILPVLVAVPKKKEVIKYTGFAEREENDWTQEYTFKALVIV